MASLTIFLAQLFLVSLQRQAVGESLILRNGALSIGDRLNREEMFLGEVVGKTDKHNGVALGMTVCEINLYEVDELKKKLSTKK